MIVVSQDKSEIINFDNVESIWVCKHADDGITIEATRTTNSTLGLYTTEERAKEVLQEILKYYNSLKRKSVYAIGDGNFTFSEKFYYEMPKE